MNETNTGIPKPTGADNQRGGSCSTNTTFNNSVGTAAVAAAAAIGYYAYYFML